MNLCLLCFHCDKRKSKRLRKFKEATKKGLWKSISCNLYVLWIKHIGIVCDFSEYVVIYMLISVHNNLMSLKSTSCFYSSFKFYVKSI